jgi:serine/threonine protein kinase
MMGRMGTEGANFRVIAGRYRLESRLGRGGMGIVWRATDQLLGRRVAVKELPPDETLSAAEARRQRELTLREARVVAQLSHPHVIVVHDVAEDDERLYIVMELIDGDSLADHIANAGPVEAVEAARIGADLLSALRTAHAAGVLHRDVKPANVLLESGTGRVVLTDFGIARVDGASTLTETGSFVGSPEYTAPERMSGARTGPASDLWSVGALLCAALSGESPFRRDSLGGILHAVVAAEIQPPAQAAPILPVVRGLLERDPDRRLDAERAERMLRTFRETGRTPPLPDDRRPDPSTGHTSTWQEVPAAQDDPGRRSSPPPTARSPRGVLVTVLLGAAMAGAGVSAAALLMNGGGNGVGVSVTSTPYTSTTSRPQPSTTSAVPTTSAPPTTSAAPTPAVPSAPSGYRLADDPAGFTLAVPHGFTRVPRGERIFYTSPGRTFQLGIRVADPAPGGPLTALRRAAAAGPATNPGYRDGRVTSATHRGQPAARWEFTWNGFSAAEGPRHTYDLCWQEGGRLYDVSVSAPVGKVREAREYFDVAVGTLVTGL